jgi:hypothetical protein
MRRNEMVGKERQKVTLSLKPGTLDILRNKAKEVGMTVTRGPQAGDGNVSEYIDSLAWAESNSKSESDWYQVVIGYRVRNGDAIKAIRREVEFRGELLADNIIWGPEMSELFYIGDEQERKAESGELDEEEARLAYFRNWYREYYGVNLLTNLLHPDESELAEHLFQTEDNRYILLVSLYEREIPREYFHPGLPERWRELRLWLGDEDYFDDGDFAERSLVELQPEDLGSRGRFRHLGRKAGIDPTLTLDEALALQQALRRPAKADPAPMADCSASSDQTDTTEGEA